MHCKVYIQIVNGEIYTKSSKFDQKVLDVKIGSGYTSSVFIFQSERKCSVLFRHGACA